MFANRRVEDNLRSGASSHPKTTSSAFIRWVRADLTLFDALAEVTDGRDPARRRIPLTALLGAVLGMFWFQLPSLLALDDQARQGRWLRRLVKPLGGHGAADDTYRNALEKLDLESLRAVLYRLNRRFLKGWGAGHYLSSQLARKLTPIGQQRLVSRVAVALDGHHLFQTTSPKRCCAGCLKRHVSVSGKRIPAYYHMAVFAQVIGAHPALILDFEPLLPGENELVAVKRLLPRLHQVYGDHIGIVVADAMYDTEPFRRQVAECGYRSVVVHKTDNHDPAWTAERNLDRRDASRAKPDLKHRPNKELAYRVWEEPAGGRRLIEVRRDTPRGTWKSQCMTDLPASQANAVAVGILLEERWDIENTGFKQLVTDWNLDRAYVHTGKPTAAWAFVLLALLAYNAFHYYVYRNLKLDPACPTRALQALRRDLTQSLDSLGLRGRPPVRGP